MSERLFDRLAQAYIGSRRLLAVTFELTHRCPLRCLHCYVDRDNRLELEGNRWMELIDELSRLGGLFVGFTGGEPFHRPDFLKLAAHARAKGLMTSLKTTGIGVRPSELDELAGLEPLRVDVSFYSDRPAMHDQITGMSGSFEQTLAAARHLLGRGVRVAAALIPLSGCDLELKKTIAGLRALGLTEIGLGAFRNELCADDRGHLLPGAEAGRMAAGGKPPRLMLEKLGGQDDCPVCDGALCGGWVGAEGIFRLCNSTGLVAGDLKKQRLADIWPDSPQLRCFFDLRWGDLPQCRGCELKPYCSFCPGAAQRVTGSMTTPIPRFCQEARWRRENEGMVDG